MGSYGISSLTRFNEEIFMSTNKSGKFIPCPNKCNGKFKVNNWGKSRELELHLQICRSKSLAFQKFGEALAGLKKELEVSIDG
jgi:hypothetical protein